MSLFLKILGNIYLVLVLRPLEHVVDDVVHLGDEPVQPDLQQHHDGAAHVLPHLGVHVAGQEEQVLDELVNVDHQRLTAPNDELVDAGDGVTPDLGVVVAKKCEKLKARTVMKVLIVCHAIFCTEGGLLQIIIKAQIQTLRGFAIVFFQFDFLTVMIG